VPTEERILGVDTGGTFTDVVAERAGELEVTKLPSTPDDPAGALLEGTARLGRAGEADHVVHGTTVALNAVLTGDVGRAALVTGEGFADLLEVGRQDRPEIYEMHPVRPAQLVPRARRFEVASRAWPAADEHGRWTGGMERVARPSAAELRRLAERVKRSRAEGVAVCLLHSWALPELEEEVGRALSKLGIPITLSAALVPEHREVERFSTAVVNAALAPRMQRYLGPLAERLGGSRLSILQSSGGTLPAERAGREPVRVLLSGPAGGVVGAVRAAREAGLGGIATLDMGGTSTDVAFHSGSDTARGFRTPDPVRVGGHPIAVPTLDVHTVGCGGGSLVRVDEGGALQVGPGSAGASPGPVCYGASDVPTVTDAHVFLGHVAEGAFLEGRLPLDTQAVQRAFERLGKDLGVSPLRAARGVLEVARASMRRAVSVMTMQRGEDPRSLSLVAFGGAGGLHAAALADSLGMPGALVPTHPGLLSAIGMTAADALREEALTILAPLADWGARRRKGALAELAERGRAALADAGHPPSRVRVERSLDLRYRGQSWELSVPDRADAEAAFHAEHARLFGHALDGREVELVCLRVRASVPRPAPALARPRSRRLPAAAVRGTRAVDLGRRVQASLVDRAALAPGHRFEGPAVVEEVSATTLVPPLWTARVTAGGHLWLAAAGSR
jgi:N-methylhydantoinase A